MKKIYSLMMLFVAFATLASAQVTEIANKRISYNVETLQQQVPTESGWYLLMQHRGGNGFVYDQGTQFHKKAVADCPASGATTATAAAYLFKLEKEGEQFAFLNGNGKYLNAADKSDTKVMFRVYNINGTAGHFGINRVSDDKILDNNANGRPLAYWGSGDVTSLNGNNDWKFVPVQFEDLSLYANVTYNFQLNGVTKHSYTTTARKGAAFPELVLPYGVVAEKPAGNVPDEDNVTCNITCTIAAGVPFVAAKDNDPMKWYVMRIRDDYFAQYKDGKVAYDATTALGELTDAKFFQLVGDPFEGFTLYNKSQANPITSENVATGADLVASTSSAARKFYLEKVSDGVFNLRETQTANGYVNRNNDKLSYWVHSAAQGEVGSNFHLYNVENLFEALKEDAQAWQTNHGVGGGNLTQASYDALTTALAGAPTTYEQYVASINQLNTALVGVQMQDLDGIYTFQSNFYESLMGVYMGDEDTDSNPLKASANINGAHKFWEVKKVGEHYTVRNLLTGKYLGNPGQRSDEAVQLQFVMSKTGTAIKGLTGNNGHHLAGHGPIVAWDYRTEASQWKVQQVEGLDVTTTAALNNYATFAAPFATTIPDGVKAYTGTINGERIQLTEVASVIPAHTGVIVKSTTPGVYKFRITASTAAAIANAFEPAFKTEAKPAGDIYTLQNNEVATGVGFYPYTAANVNAFKCFVIKTAGSPVQGFSLDFGGVTAIEAATTEKGQLEIFDLQGRRVNPAKSGLYIVNGKKMILQ